MPGSIIKADYPGSRGPAQRLEATGSGRTSSPTGPTVAFRGLASAWATTASRRSDVWGIGLAISLSNGGRPWATTPSSGRVFRLHSSTCGSDLSVRRVTAVSALSGTNMRFSRRGRPAPTGIRAFVPGALGPKRELLCSGTISETGRSGVGRIVQWRRSSSGERKRSR